MSARATRLSTLTHRDADWAGLHVVVTGLGVSGFAAADALLEHGARVHVVDATTPEPESLLAQRAQILEVLGARLLLGDGSGGSLPVPAEEIDLVVTSPGWPPHQPLLAEAAAAGIPIWGDVELAWRADEAELFGPRRTWLAVTGTNGKTTTTAMLEAICLEAGMAARACGNIGLPVTDVLLAEPRVEVLAAELSSFQLHWAPSCRPEVGVVLNIAEDHLDWHGSMEAYAEAKAQVLVQAGVPGTGTASDAIVVLCPDPQAHPAREPVAFAGVRSPLGRHLARAVHDAVAAGLAAHPWPPPDADPAVVW